MNVTCTQCQTVFRVDPGQGPGGRSAGSLLGLRRRVLGPARGGAAVAALRAGSRCRPRRRRSRRRAAHPPPAPAPAPAPHRPRPRPAPQRARTASRAAPRRCARSGSARPGRLLPRWRPARCRRRQRYPPFRPSTPPAPAFRRPLRRTRRRAPPAQPARARLLRQPPAPSTPARQRRAARGVPPIPFLSQDPEARARRLARALVSDIVVYHPAKRRDALRDGSLKLLFEEEIRKSWDEYVDQVGRELADSTTFFTDALNEILADGQPVFP